MAGDPLMPAIAPTTQAAPKLGRSIAALIARLTGAGKFVSRSISTLVGAQTFAANTNAVIPNGSHGPLVPMSAVRSCHGGAVLLLLECSFLLRDRLFDRVATIQPLEESGSWDASLTRPFRGCLGFSVHRVFPANAAIVHLHDARSPTAILGRIRSIIVDAIESFSRFRLPHVGKEVLELPPTVADRDAATAVITEEPIVLVQAPLAHTVPYTVNSAAAFAVRHVRRMKLSRPDRRSPSVLTPTGNDFPVAQVTSAYILLSSAVASDGQKLPVIRDGNHRQQPEPRSKWHINSLDHFYTLIHHFGKGKRYAF